MNLKEAFRYQNKLQSLLDEAQGILDCDSNVTKEIGRASCRERVFGYV